MVSTKKVEELEERIEKLEEALFEDEYASQVGKSKQMAINELVGQLDLPYHAEKVAAIGYYFEEFEGEGEFTSADIEDGYRKARLSAPENPSDAIAKAANKMYVMEVGERDGMKLWTLTQTGLEFIREGIAND